MIRSLLLLVIHKRSFTFLYNVILHSKSRRSGNFPSCRAERQEFSFLMTSFPIQRSTFQSVPTKIHFLNNRPIALYCSFRLFPLFSRLGTAYQMTLLAWQVAMMVGCKLPIRRSLPCKMLGHIDWWGHPLSRYVHWQWHRWEWTYVP